MSDVTEAPGGALATRPPQPEAPEPAAAGRRHWPWLLALAMLGTYLASGFYVVDADQQGVVRRFGALLAHVGPGMHYRLPWPVDRVDVLKTTSVMKIGAGFEFNENADQAPVGTELLTGDTNLLNIALVVQYVIRDPADYLFRTEAPQALVADVARGVLTETVIGMPIDEVLTTGRLAIQNNVKAKGQAILDRYRSGVQIVSANIMTMGFDKSVAQAFQDVANAMSDREKVQNEAHAYANDQIPKARGDAAQLVSDAENYRRQRIAEAIGNSSRFVALLKEYEKAPEVTRTRLYLESMEKILPKVKMYVIDSQGGKVPVNLRVTNP